MNEEIIQACKEIKKGNLVCFPTETVYALATNCQDENSINKIYALKQRDSNKPLAILVKDIIKAQEIAQFNDTAKKIVNKFCPGPITIILPKKNKIKLANNLTAGQNTVGIRIPDHEIALSILNGCGGAVAATSVNISGKNSITNYHDIEKNFGKEISYIVKQENDTDNLASTVVDLSNDEINILREGKISKEQILSCL